MVLKSKKISKRSSKNISRNRKLSKKMRGGAGNIISNETNWKAYYEDLIRRHKDTETKFYKTLTDEHEKIEADTTMSPAKKIMEHERLVTNALTAEKSTADDFVRYIKEYQSEMEAYKDLKIPDSTITKLVNKYITEFKPSEKTRVLNIFEKIKAQYDPTKFRNILFYPMNNQSQNINNQTNTSSAEVKFIGTIIKANMERVKDFINYKTKIEDTYINKKSSNKPVTLSNAIKGLKPVGLSYKKLSNPSYSSNTDTSQHFLKILETGGIFKNSSSSNFPIKGSSSSSSFVKKPQNSSDGTNYSKYGSSSTV